MNGSEGGARKAYQPRVGRSLAVRASVCLSSRACLICRIIYSTMCSAHSKFLTCSLNIGASVCVHGRGYWTSAIRSTEWACDDYLAPRGRKTPLDMAVDRGNYNAAAVKLLIKAGEAVDAKDTYGCGRPGVWCGTGLAGTL